MIATQEVCAWRHVESKRYHGEYLIISAFLEYRQPLHIYILTIKQVQLANMEPIPLDDPKKYLGIAC